MSRKPRHLLDPFDLSRKEFADLLDLSARLKKGEARGSLNGRSMGLLFFDPSLRTRVSMEVAIRQLGGHSVTLDMGKGVWGLEHREGVRMDGAAAEHVKEAAPVLAQYVQALGIRAFSKLHSWAEERTDPVLTAFAKASPVPVLNLEGSRHHPCQGLADALTLRELLKEPKGKRILITWAYHPKPLPMAVPHSILAVSSMLGMNVRLCHPKGFDLDEEVLTQARQTARNRGGSVEVSHDPNAAYEGAEVVYAKAWGAQRYYGHWEEEREIREKLRHWIVTAEKMKRAKKARFMHCLPVRRNVVVEDAVLDSPASAVVQQAGNRLHVQKAMLLKLIPAQGRG